MNRPFTRDALDVHGGSAGSISWIAALAIAALVIGSTLALVAVNESPDSAAPQVTVGQ